MNDKSTASDFSNRISLHVHLPLSSAEDAPGVQWYFDTFAMWLNTKLMNMDILYWVILVVSFGKFGLFCGLFLFWLSNKRSYVVWIGLDWSGVEWSELDWCSVVRVGNMILFLFMVTKYIIILPWEMNFLYSHSYAQTNQTPSHPKMLVHDKTIIKNIWIQINNKLWYFTLNWSEFFSVMEENWNVLLLLHFPFTVLNAISLDFEFEVKQLLFRVLIYFNWILTREPLRQSSVLFENEKDLYRHSSIQYLEEKKWCRCCCDLVSDKLSKTTFFWRHFLPPSFDILLFLICHISF